MAYQTDERAKLDFLLGEMRRWQQERRFPEESTTTLVREYTARRDALVLAPGGFDLLSREPAPPPRYEPTALPLVPPPPAFDFGAFWERNSVLLLLGVGSLLVLGGLGALARWQWEGWGRPILLFLLLALTGATAGISEWLGREHPLGGRAVRLLSAAVLPLNGVALYACFRGSIPWETVTFATGTLCTGAYLWGGRRTGDRAFIPLLAGSWAATVWGAAWHLPVDARLLGTELGLLAGAAVCFGRRAAQDRTVWSAAGHLLMTAALAAALFHAITAGFLAVRQEIALIALLAAGVYGFAGLQWKLPALGWAAAGMLFLGGEFFVPASATFAVRGAAAATVGALILLGLRWGGRLTTPGILEPYRWSGRAFVAGSLLPFLAGAIDPKRDIPLALLFAALAALVAFADVPGTKNPANPWRVYGTGVCVLAAARLCAVPIHRALTDMFPSFLPNEAVWLLVPALLFAGAAWFGERQNRTTSLDSSALFRPTDTLALRRMAGVTTLWACAAQTLLLFGTLSQRGAGVAVLLLAACGIAVLGKLPQGARRALLPLSVAYVVLLMGTFGQGWGLPPLVLALALFVVGGTLWLRGDRSAAFALPLVGAAGHAAAAILPPSLNLYWTLATLPVLGWLLWKNGGEEETSADNGADTLCALISAAFVLHLTQYGGQATVATLAATALPAALCLAAALRGDRARAMRWALVIAQGGALLLLSHYPQPWSLSAGQTGWVLACGAALYVGGAAILAATGRERLARVVQDAALVQASLAVIGCFALSVAVHDHWAQAALLLIGGIFATVGTLRRDKRGAHAAFAAAYGAFIGYFGGTFAVVGERIDWLILPLGAYLIYVAESEGIEPLSYLATLALLTPTFLSALQQGAGSTLHGLTLVGECLAVLALGITRRKRAYVGGGILYLVGFLATKLIAPLFEASLGIALTLVGLVLVAGAIFLERRKDRLVKFFAPQDSEESVPTD